MNKFLPDTALIISLNANECNATWMMGTGGWLPPQDREVLDWVTLINWMGWKSKIIHPAVLNAGILTSGHIKWLILADDPELYEASFTKVLISLLDDFPVLVISKAANGGTLYAELSGSASGSTIVAGRITWNGFPGEKIKTLLNEISIPCLECKKTVIPLVVANDTDVLVSASNRACGRWVVLGFHPGEARDLDGYFTSLIKDILVYQSCLPVAWFDFEKTVVLRMDDPGSPESVHHSSYQTEKLTEKEWKQLGLILKRHNGSMTLGYVPGWVDDGDEKRGELFINGVKTERRGGKIYPSPLVTYKPVDTGKARLPVDYVSEFNGIQLLRKEGIVETELHGFTHIHPDKETWLRAADKHESKSWYREFGRNTLDYIKKRPAEEHPFTMGLNAFREIFQYKPCTLICPGDEFTPDVLHKAWEAQLHFVSSYYLAVRINEQLCWDQHVCAPYLDEFATSWFDTGLPVTGYFHDFDIKTQGLDWFENCLDGWRRCGAARFTDFRQLSWILSHNISCVERENQLELMLSLAYHAGNSTRQISIGISIPSRSFSCRYQINGEEKKHSIDLPH